MGRVLVGLCSWTDKELVDSGKFYPPEAKSAEARLRFYTTQFPPGGSGQHLLRHAFGADGLPLGGTHPPGVHL